MQIEISDRTDLYIAAYVDYGETCDGKPRILGIFLDKKEAIENVHKDINHYCEGHDDYSKDLDKMCVWCDCDSDIGCEWTVVKQKLTANLK